MIFLPLAFLSLAADEQSAGQDIVSLVITTIISASVFAALVTGITQYLINRRNSRIAERKNSVDIESDHIRRYKEQAIEERNAKESAVTTVKNVLTIVEQQVESLKNTISTLNQTIEIMSHAANAQQDIIDQLTTQRDRQESALARAQQEVELQRSEVSRLQREILDITYPQAELDRLRNQLEEKQPEEEDGEEQDKTA